MKLHLGCGEVRFEGYVNIDYPASEHTVQATSGADLRADLLGLRYALGSVEEVRLHHVFEHFPRPVACALLASWASWLAPGGVLRIETPDFDRTARAAVSPFRSARRRAVARRHLFGSHEAGWAVHWEGYGARTYRDLLPRYGFVVDRIARNAWRGTYNIEVFGSRSAAPADRTGFEAQTRTYLARLCVDDSTTERKLLEVWMARWNEQVDRSWASGG